MQLYPSLCAFEGLRGFECEYAIEIPPLDMVSVGLRATFSQVYLDSVSNFWNPWGNLVDGLLEVIGFDTHGARARRDGACRNFDFRGTLNRLARRVCAATTLPMGPF